MLGVWLQDVVLEEFEYGCTRAEPESVGGFKGCGHLIGFVRERLVFSLHLCRKVSAIWYATTMGGWGGGLALISRSKHKFAAPL